MPTPRAPARPRIRCLRRGDIRAIAQELLILPFAVLDIENTRIPNLAAHALSPERLWVAPDCGLRTLPRDVAREKLARLVAAAKDVRAEL